MEYNTARPDLKIPEYGRNVQRMVDYCLSIEDRDHRNKVAQSIIDVIGNLNPHLRDVPDFKVKMLGRSRLTPSLGRAYEQGLFGLVQCDSRLQAENDCR
jgi:hypothetical protein